MVIKKSQAIKKTVGPMVISEYKINPDFSAAYVEINGNHGTLKCLNEDRIYFVVEGEGKFVVNNEETLIAAQDLVFIPKNTPYNITGNLKYFLVCSPEFKPEDDVFLKLNNSKPGFGSYELLLKSLLNAQAQRAGLQVKQ